METWNLENGCMVLSGFVLSGLAVRDFGGACVASRMER